jgi:hypothetical protein
MALFAVFTRDEVEAVLLEVFPKATPHWSDPNPGPDEWVAHIKIGFFDIKTHAYQRESRKNKIGDITVEIIGIRASTDSSGALIWGRKAEGLDEYKDALGEVREHLLGIAAGITFICGKARSLSAAEPPTVGEESPLDGFTNIFEDHTQESRHPSLVDLGLPPPPENDTAADEVLEALSNAPVKRLRGRRPPEPPKIKPLTAKDTDGMLDEMLDLL